MLDRNLGSVTQAGFINNLNDAMAWGLFPLVLAQQGFALVLGWGTAMVYPTFLATIAENTHPEDRAHSLGVFRMWRDLGYAAGALLTGLIADLFGMNAGIVIIGALTPASAFLLQQGMRCRTEALKLTAWFAQKLFIKRETCLKCLRSDARRWYNSS